ncbi:MAG: helix-turn-helix domain-containing protein, partial [Alphaproteobacteria bacterium]|nr:helix-turn-helix domain-containing protein [Alphaproteobacteria bacterium]
MGPPPGAGTDGVRSRAGQRLDRMRAAYRSANATVCRRREAAKAGGVINRRTSTRTDAIESDMNAAELGAMLSEVRRAQARELRDVASELRIRPAYLQAIEEGRLKDLPGSAYALGFLRTYAESLGLNADEVINRYRLTDSSLNRQTALVMPAPTEEGRLPSGSILLVAAILALGAYGGWYYLSSRGQDPVEVVSAVPRQLAALVGLSERDGAAPAAAKPAPGRAVSTRIESGGLAQDGFGSREEDPGQTPRAAEPAATTPPAVVAVAPPAVAPPAPASNATTSTTTPAPVAAPPVATAVRPHAGTEHPPLPAATPLL